MQDITLARFQPSHKQVHDSGSPPGSHLSRASWFYSELDERKYGHRLNEPGSINSLVPDPTHIGGRGTKNEYATLVLVLMNEPNGITLRPTNGKVFERRFDDARVLGNWVQALHFMERAPSMASSTPDSQQTCLQSNPRTLDERTYHLLLGSTLDEG